MTPDDIGREFPFSSLHNDQFEDLIERTNRQINDNDTKKF